MLKRCLRYPPRHSILKTLWNFPGQTWERPSVTWLGSRCQRLVQVMLFLFQISRKLAPKTWYHLHCGPLLLFPFPISHFFSFLCFPEEEVSRKELVPLLHGHLAPLPCCAYCSSCRAAWHAPSPRLPAHLLHFQRPRTALCLMRSGLPAMHLSHHAIVNIDISLF